MTTRINVDGYTYTYDSNTGNLVFTQYTGTDIDTTTPVIEEYNEYIFTVNPSPITATVTLTANGQTVQGTGPQSISVREGTIVSYTVEQTGYGTATGSYTIDHSFAITVDLVANLYTITINPIPADATVIITLESDVIEIENYNYTIDANEDIILTEYTGNDQNPVIPVSSGNQYHQVGNSITVPYGTRIRIEVSKVGYISQGFPHTVTQDETITVRLHRTGTMFFYNYGSCAICFMTGTRDWDLGFVDEDYIDSLDLGTDLITGQYDDHMNLGEV